MPVRITATTIARSKANTQGWTLATPILIAAQVVPQRRTIAT